VYRTNPSFPAARLVALAMSLHLVVIGASSAQQRPQAKPQTESDPYADYVWPPPPDTPRIKLTAVISAREDVESDSKLSKFLIGSSPKNPWDEFKKPYAVEFDPQGRILVSDSMAGAVIRIDRQGRQWDVLGKKGAVTVGMPMGLDVGPDGTVYVADLGLKQVLAFAPDGGLRAAYGRAGELTNPTDAALSPDGRSLYVADSKEHRIVVYDIASGALRSRFGEGGQKPGQFFFPTSLSFAGDGSLLVVDQMNSRVQVLTPAGELIDKFGDLGVGFGKFVRPKDVAVDSEGLIYVTDNAFNNVQIFDSDFSLLTFVGQGGQGPGRFHGVSGVAVRHDEFAVVDQLGHRLQVFKYIAPRSGE